jgi:hypothetical protein
VTAPSDDSQGAARSRSKESQEEVARSLERELKLLTEDRQDRARRLGIDIEVTASKALD